MDFANVKSLDNTGESATTGDPSLSISITPSSLVVSGFTHDETSTFAPQDSQTEILDVGYSYSGQDGRFVCGYKITSGVTSQRMQWTGTDGYFAQASASFKARMAGSQFIMVG
jgi:hypothetical protein